MPARKKPARKAAAKAAKTADRKAGKPAVKKPAAKKKPAVAKKKPAVAKKKPAVAKKRPVAAKQRPVAKKKPAAKRPAAKKARRVAAKGRSTGPRPSARTQPRTRTAEDRVTPLVHDSIVAVVPDVEGFRPSRILTTRPRPVIRQVDPSATSPEAARTLQPWEIEVDDLAELMAARAAEETAAEQAKSKLVTTPESARARIGEARAAGWVDDRRPTAAGLPDTRVRLVHPSCKFIDGKAIRDVSLSVHPASGRATLLVEGGARLRSASWRMHEEEDLPSQIAKLLDDPARLSRVEHASAQDLLAELEALDRAVATDLRALVGRGEQAIESRLRRYVADFAATHSAFGLPATVDAVWDRFGMRRGCVLERLGLPEDTRHAVADAFDVALDSA